MQFWRSNRTVALIFPREDVGKILIVAAGFAVGRLVFLAEMAAAGFVTGQATRPARSSD